MAAIRWIFLSLIHILCVPRLEFYTENLASKDSSFDFDIKDVMVVESDHWLPFINGNTGGTICDTSGYGNHGIVESSTCPLYDMDSAIAVSYTHLDVYKRQQFWRDNQYSQSHLWFHRPYFSCRDHQHHFARKSEYRYEGHKHAQHNCQGLHHRYDIGHHQHWDVYKRQPDLRWFTDCSHNTLPISAWYRFSLEPMVLST